MGAITGARGLTLLDACVVINLYATRRMEEIVRSVPTLVGIVDVVQREAGYARRGGVGEDAEEREAIDLGPMIAAGVLVPISPTEPELESFLELTLQLEDGEAMTAAVALARQAVVATDERKAIRILEGRVRIRSSLELVRAWPDAGGLAEDDVRTVLNDLHQRGHYVPSERHPLRPWWDAVLGDD